MVLKGQVTKGVEREDSDQKKMVQRTFPKQNQATGIKHTNNVG